jgi:hypothetical protein
VAVTVTSSEKVSGGSSAEAVGRKDIKDTKDQNDSKDNKDEEALVMGRVIFVL